MVDVPYLPTNLQPSEDESRGDPARRAIVMKAGLEVFSNKGFHLTSMEDIACRAGVSKPILYQHFPSKHDLYLGILDERVDVLVQQIRSAINRAEGNKNRLKAAIACYFRLADDADKGYRLIFESDFTMNSDVRARVEDLVSQVSRIVGVEVSEQTGMSMGQANILAGGLCGMAQASAWRWLRLGRPIPIEQAVEQIFDLAWTGLSAIEKNETA